MVTITSISIKFNYVCTKQFFVSIKNKLLIENVIRNQLCSKLEFEKFKNLYQNKSKNFDCQRYDANDIPQSVKRFSNLMVRIYVLNDEINVLDLQKVMKKEKFRFLNNLKNQVLIFDIIPENFSKLKEFHLNITRSKKT